nr:hypothetical protein [Tanacetum cinerariifolium]
SQEDDSDSDDKPDVLIIHSTPTLVVPIVDEVTTQNDGTKSDHATTHSHVSAGRPIGSASRPDPASRPSGSAARTPVPAGRILGKFTTSASSKRFPQASNEELLYIHDGLKIFDCLKS